MTVSRYTCVVILALLVITAGAMTTEYAGSSMRDTETVGVGVTDATSASLDHNGNQPRNRPSTNTSNSTDGTPASVTQGSIESTDHGNSPDNETTTESNGDTNTSTTETSTVGTSEQDSISENETVTEGSDASTMETVVSGVTSRLAVSVGYFERLRFHG